MAVIIFIFEGMKMTVFRLIAVKIDRWNHDLSPWAAPAVFGKENFGDGADEDASG